MSQRFTSSSTLILKVTSTKLTSSKTPVESMMPFCIKEALSSKVFNPVAAKKLSLINTFIFVLKMEKGISFY